MYTLLEDEFEEEREEDDFAAMATDLVWGRLDTAPLAVASLVGFTLAGFGWSFLEAGPGWLAVGVALATFV